MTTQALGLRRLLTLQLVVGAVLTGAAAGFAGIQPAVSFAAGALLMVLNVAVLGWAWNRILEKKSIAWTSGIIVIKYAVVLSSIVLLSRRPEFHAVAAGLGIGSFVIAAVIAALASETREG